MSREHWQQVYATKADNAVSWYESTAEVSLALIRGAGIGTEAAVVDIGGGASHLVDALLAQGQNHIAVLDLAGAALEVAKRRTGAKGSRVEWIESDVTRWKPKRQYDAWHDRATFHFLTEEADQKLYLEVLLSALRPGGTAIVGTFALNGPQTCSGLPLIRHDAASLSRRFGRTFELLDSQNQDHVTPWGSVQNFQFARFRSRAAS